MNASLGSTASALAEVAASRGEQYVTAIVQQAVHQIESGIIPPNPKAEHASDYCWRLRPSQLRALALQEFLEPPPMWGARINLSNLCIGSAHSETIGRALILNETVTSLDLSGCDIGTAGAVKLFGCLERNRSLKHLSLNGNFLEAPVVEGAKKCIQKLESLHLACNRLGDRGLMDLADAIRETRTLQFLNVRANGATGIGVFRLIEALDSGLLNRLSEKTRDDLALQRQVLQKRESAYRALHAPQPPLLQNPTTPASLSDAGGSTTFRRSLVLDAARKGLASAGSPMMGPENAAMARRFSSLARRSLASREATTTRDALSDSARAGTSSLQATLNEIELSRPPTPLTLPFAATQSNASINALWVNGNVPVPDELLDALKQILASRFPQPPEGANVKKKKGKGSKKK